LLSQLGHEVEMGDSVRIVSTADTVAAGFAERTGICYGLGTPSLYPVEIIGAITKDRAFNVGFTDGTTAWFDPSVVAFVDVNAGQTIGIGGRQFVRAVDGHWEESHRPGRG
jgi:hypothetical protein